jgi:two-component system chemotaxis response regulator CheY
MQFVHESAEHHFLTLLEKIKQNPSGWAGVHAALSEKLDHADLIANPAGIRARLAAMLTEGQALAQEILKDETPYAEATLYLFTDSDIVMMARPEDELSRKALRAIHKSLSERPGAPPCMYSDMAKDLYDYQKMADQRLLGAKRIAAYEHLADANRVASIGVRRQRRPEPLVMIVEDDRFTSSYAANILNKEFELVLARSGEEAISCYIEHAPDIMFLDVHLPGISGHDTLRAVRVADPQAYVVMLSVDTAKPNVVNASQVGAAGFLKKPFSKERMLHITHASPFIKNRARGAR